MILTALGYCTPQGAWDLFNSLEDLGQGDSDPLSPTISSVIADDGDAAHGNGDTITVSFSEATNQVAVATKTQLGAIFIFNQSLGTDYTGSWSAADTLVITIADSTGAAPPTIGILTLSFQPGNGVKNAAGTSLESTGVSPAIASNWGMLSITLDASQDTDINSASPTTIYGGSSSLIANQAGPTDLGNRRILVMFDLSPIPVGAIVNSAVLQLEKNGGVVAPSIAFNVHRVTSAWDVFQATWNDRINGTPWGSGGGGDYDAVSVASTLMAGDAVYQWSHADLTALVDAWHQGTFTNYGVILGSPNPGVEDREFASRSHLIAAKRPKLHVDYTIP